MSVTTIAPSGLSQRRKAGQSCDLIDVRTPSEFREVHVEFARNIPLDQLEPEAIMKARNGNSGEPLYVICQSCGWLFFLGLQLVFTFALSSKDKPGDDPVLDAGLLTMVILQGWLITHYTRPLIARWGWKALGWRALLPRMTGVSIYNAASEVIWSSDMMTDLSLARLVSESMRAACNEPGLPGTCVADGEPMYIFWLWRPNTCAPLPPFAAVVLRCKVGAKGDQPTLNFVYSLVRPALEILTRAARPPDRHRPFPRRPFRPLAQRRTSS